MDTGRFVALGCASWTQHRAHGAVWAHGLAHDFGSARYPAIAASCRRTAAAGRSTSVGWRMPMRQPEPFRMTHETGPAARRQSSPDARSSSPLRLSEPLRPGESSSSDAAAGGAGGGVATARAGAGVATVAVGARAADGGGGEDPTVAGAFLAVARRGLRARGRRSVAGLATGREVVRTAGGGASVWLASSGSPSRAKDCPLRLPAATVIATVSARPMTAKPTHRSCWRILRD